MNTVTPDLHAILSKLAAVGVHIATVGEQRYLVLAGTDADSDHPYAVGLAVNAGNEPTSNKLTSLTRDGQTPQRTWRQAPPVCHTLGIGDLMAMAEAAFNSGRCNSLRHCLDQALVSAWHHGIQPNLLDILLFMQSAVDSGDLAKHEHTSAQQLAQVVKWLATPNVATTQFYFAECLTARLAIRIARRAHRSQLVTA